MKLIHSLILFLSITACSNSSSSDNQGTDSVTDPTPVAASWPDFNADSAYTYIAAQVSMGPRTPASDAHHQCEQYIIGKLTQFGADTIISQKAQVTAYNGNQLPIHNIYARFNNAATRRILLAAHYDTRPWADQDTQSQHSPIDGANDGASGVGVMLELARIIALQNPAVGVDLFFTDAEDYGTPEFEDITTDESSSWCLGSQYWAKSDPYASIPNRPAYGILLDMVGGKNALFYREYFSEHNAAWLNQKVWQAAKDQQVSRFVDQQRGAVTDDHIYISAAGVPCIDIIECANPDTGAFPTTWHTHNDNLQSIDKATLSDVGATLARLIYTEKAAD